MGFDPLQPQWDWSDCPRVVGEECVEDNAVKIPTSAGVLAVTLHDFGARLRFGPERAFDYGMLIDEPARHEVRVARTDTTITVSNAALSITFDTQDLGFAVNAGNRCLMRSAVDGHFVRQRRLPPFSKTDDGWFAHLDLASHDRVYGLGEKWGRLDKRGQLIRSFNEDALGVNAEASYKNTPFAWSPSGWGVFCHTPAPVTHGVGFAPWSQRSYGLHVEDDTLDLFIMLGENGGELIARYTALTGRSPMPPDWSLGAILSKAYYRDSSEILEAARELRRRNAPCDTITLDGRAWLDTDTRFSFDWDASRYPDPKAVLDELHDLNFKVCVWEYPLVSVRNPLFDELADKGWLLKHAETGEAYRYQWDPEPFGKVLTPLPDSGLIDFTHPDAYAYWRDRHEALFAVGVDMIKADFGEQVQEDMVAHSGDTGRALHNVYALLYNRCVYEAAERYAKHGPFLFSRSSWTGCQRYPAQWGGDPQADFEGMAASFRGGLSWGLTGAPYYATDVGGFYGDTRNPKLYVRWLQAAVFSAHMRLHGIGPREPWTYGPQAEAAAMAALKLRYRLLPYLKSVIKAAHETGAPVQRAMVLACPDEPEAWAFENQFFFGPDLLVAPCVTEDDQVELYLPSGSWRRFPDGETVAGGAALRLDLELDEIAVFARVGSTIPLGPEVEFTEQNPRLETIEEWWRAS